MCFVPALAAVLVVSVHGLVLANGPHLAQTIEKVYSLLPQSRMNAAIGPDFGVPVEGKRLLNADMQRPS